MFILLVLRKCAVGLFFLIRLDYRIAHDGLFIFDLGILELLLLYLLPYN